MKPDRFLLAFLALAVVALVAGFLVPIPDRTRSKVIAKAEKDTASVEARPESWSREDTNVWLRVMTIWQCDDGTFEVKTPLTLRAKVPTLDEAREARYEWALELAEKQKAGLLGPYGNFPVLPNCGKQVQ